MKKILALVACLSLVASLAIGGSIAYLTDRDSEANVFTIGDVSIDLSETFGQGSELLPGVNIQKEPIITNTGDNDAWVWATIAFPKAFDNDDASMNAIHFNYKSDYVTAGKWNWKDSAGKWNYQEVTLDDGVTYNLYTVLYETALKPGAATEPVMTNVYMDTHIDITPDGQMYRVENGETTELDWNINNNGSPVIYVSAYAIQKEGFDTVQDAYAAYNAQWGDKGTEYGTPAVTVSSADELDEYLDVEDNTTTLNQNVVTQDMPVFANWAATEGYTFNGNGNTITMKASDEQTFDWTENGTIPLMANVFSSEDGAQVTVNDVTIAGTMQSVMFGNYEKTNQGRHNTVANNVNIVGTKVVSLSANISPALSIYGTAVLNNCNVYGTTLSPLDTDPMWPVYDVAVVNFSNTTINGGKYGSFYTWQKAYLEINDAKVDSILSACRKTNDFENGGLVIGKGTTVGEITVTNANGVLTVKSGATVNKLDLTKVTNKTGITIEDGATVMEIVVDDATVDFNTWKNS